MFERPTFFSAIKEKLRTLKGRQSKPPEHFKNHGEYTVINLTEEDHNAIQKITDQGPSYFLNRAEAGELAVSS